MKKLLIPAALAFAALGFFFAHGAEAQTQGSCCVHTTSKLDSLLNPTVGSDENFFTAKTSGPPNVLLVVDNSGSMMDWPFALCEPANGAAVGSSGDGYRNNCNCEALNNLGYVATTNYEKELDNLNTSGGSNYYSGWFPNGEFFEVRPRRSQSFGGSAYSKLTYGLKPPSSGGFNPQGNKGFAANAYSNACDTVSNPTVLGADGKTNKQRCMSCLQDKGYWFDEDDSRSMMKGNFLNYFSPKYIMLRRVLKQVIREIRPVRMSMLSFGYAKGASGGERIDPDPQSDDVDLSKWTGTPYLVKEFNPSCNLSDPSTNKSSFDSNRNTFINEVTKIRFAFPFTPLSRSVLMGGYVFNRKETPSVYANSLTNWPAFAGWDSSFISSFEEGGSNQLSVCSGCTFSSMIVLTDGQPNDQWGSGPDYESSMSVPGGSEVPVTGCTTCSQSRLDEITRFIWSKDIRTDHDGQQKVATYTIGFGLTTGSDAAKLLRSAADVGGGEFYNAFNGTQLKQALMNVFESINTRNTAFSSANIASLQSGNQTLAALLPRMRPEKNKSWAGELYRFNQYNEFVGGAEHPEDNDAQGTPGYLSEIFLTDTQGHIVVEDETGAFVRRVNRNALATPFWEAADQLRARTGGYDSREIYTVIDSNDDGKFTSADDQIAFTPANAGALWPYMGLSEPGLCPDVATGSAGTIFSKLLVRNSDIADLCGAPFYVDGGVSDAGTDAGFSGFVGVTQAEANLCCAKVVIDWVRGHDFADEDVDDITNEVRDDVLGDIFHSSPISVDPPSPRFLCDLGISSQCVRTLYSTQLPVNSTPLHDYGNVTDVCGSRKNDAYDEYLRTNRTREKLILVGANDGMLHAFQNGTGSLATITDGGTLCANGAPQVTYDQGTGNEAWAFIPPDQLPRIHERIFKHTYYVDGDIMVRDIWADSTTEVGTKNYALPSNSTDPNASDVRSPAGSEFHTIAIASEGRGGNHYFAVELRWNNDSTKATNAIVPRFRWMFPQPCSPESDLMGKTLFALSPKPPPVGPVLLKGGMNMSGTPTLNASGSGVNRYGASTTERWVAMLSGGWSPSLDKGRGIYMVDVWEPLINSRADNLWWKFEFKESPSSTDPYQARKFVTHSIAAPVAMVDFGTNGNPKLDGYFDTMLVGDTRGQLWLGRMWDPATLDSDDLVNNWPMARAFEQDKNVATSSASDNIGGAYSFNDKNQWPFYYLASSGLQQERGVLRAFLGSGNRYALLEDNAGTCRFDNPLACSKYGCSKFKVTTEIDKAGRNVTKNETHWSGAVFEHGKLEESSSSTTACGTVTASFGEHTADCSTVLSSSATVIPPTNLGDPSIVCDASGVDGGYYCRNTNTQTIYTDDIPVNITSSLLSTIGRNRFYGFRVFGAGKSMSLSSDAGANEDPNVYDNSRLTDRGGTSGSGDLVNVTNVGCNANGCDGGAGTNDEGWFLSYPIHNQKTASGSALLASCVLWSNIYPGSPIDGGCSTTVQASSDLYQADFVTGAPNCAFGFLNSDGGYSRYQTRSVVAPPPEPATAIMIGPNNQIKYSALLVEPGKDKATEVTVNAGNDVLQAVYELPLSRQVHQCRHVDGSGNCVTTP